MVLIPPNNISLKIIPECEKCKKKICPDAKRCSIHMVCAETSKCNHICSMCKYKKELENAQQNITLPRLKLLYTEYDNLQIYYYNIYNHIFKYIHDTQARNNFNLFNIDALSTASGPYAHPNPSNPGKFIA